MTLPETLTQYLDGEEPVAEVTLGGDDRLVVTPTRTLVYRAEGLLSDETVEEFAHDAERISLSTGRRKAKLTIDYGLDGEETLALPKDKLDAVLHPLLAGVLDAHGITDPGETVKRTFRFSELTLIVTDRRVVKHIGQAVWDEEHEEYAFENVTDLEFEPGNVATSVVLTHDGRQERFKAPNDEARAVEAAITDALLSYHDVRDVAELRAQTEADEEADAESTESNSPFGEGPDLFGDTGTDADDGDASDDAEAPSDGTANNTTDRIIEQVAQEASRATDTSAADAETAATATDPGIDDLAAEIDDLRSVIETQQAELERQNDLIEQLIEELRQGR
ncbi:hypothetical protein JCM30237_20440 [Halolamina litorea]|uniref:DUF7115 domain-containing protein n=1 Tax=Halolamina litorea TaxID=1515593 RepID=A0ABD6BPY2_9EURY|nr:hypothetical protein [Halolamina litorea]